MREVASLDDVLGSSLAPRRFALALAGSFAALALLLAAVGTYGVLALAVTARTREFGVRRALGATSTGILGNVLLQGMRWSALGLAVGLAGAAAGSRLLRGMLFGVTPLHAGTFAAAAAAAFIVACVACIVPAIRATRVDPIRSMRVE